MLTKKLKKQEKTRLASRFFVAGNEKSSKLISIFLKSDRKKKIEKIIKKVYFLKNPIAIRFIAGYN